MPCPSLQVPKDSGMPKLFVPVLKWIEILCKSQTFCARPKDDFHSLNLVFVPAQNPLMQH